MVQMRTRIMNQLQALAMNEGYRWKKKLFSEQGRAQLGKLSLAPWASRRRQELLELLDRMNPTARYRPWREVGRRPLDWASRSLQREFEEVIMVEVLIGEMVGSD
jgi:hypothetical protein